MLKVAGPIPGRACTYLYNMCTRRSGGTAHEGGGATSQLDIPSPTPLFVAGCGRLQLEVVHWATSVMNAQCPHKWWSTLKSAVFGSGSDSSLPPLIGAGGGLVCESVGKADML